jgi:hypothetical protein
MRERALIQVTDPARAGEMTFIERLLDAEVAYAICVPRSATRRRGRSRRRAMTGSIASRSRRLVVLAFVVATACGTTTPCRVAPSAAGATHDDRGQGQGRRKRIMAVLYEREAGELPGQLVRAPDGRWTVSIPGIAPPEITIDEDERVVFVDSVIGSRTPVYCQVYDGELEIAGTLHRMLGLVPQGTPVDRIVPWAVTIDDDHPAAWLEVFYRADRAQMGAAGGHLKMAISARADHPLLCFHDEIGYRESFRRVAQSFFESFEPAQRAAEPKYIDVMIRYAEDVPIGFKKSVLTEAEGRAGYERWTTTATLMRPVEQDELHLKEDREVYILDATRHVEFGRFTTVADGELVLDLALRRVEGNLYRYAGEIYGVHERGEFRTVDPRGLASAPLIATTLDRLLATSAGFSLDQEEYVPTFDPTTPQRVTYFHHADDPPRLVRMQIGDGELQRIVDEHGMPIDDRLEEEGRRFSIRRALRKGKI